MKVLPNGPFSVLGSLYHAAGGNTLVHFFLSCNSLLWFLEYCTLLLLSHFRDFSFSEFFTLFPSVSYLMDPITFAIFPPGLAFHPGSLFLWTASASFMTRKWKPQHPFQLTSVFMRFSNEEWPSLGNSTSLMPTHTYQVRWGGERQGQKDAYPLSTVPHWNQPITSTHIPAPQSSITGPQVTYRGGWKIQEAHRYLVSTALL